MTCTSQTFHQATPILRIFPNFSDRAKSFESDYAKNISEGNYFSLIFGIAAFISEFRSWDLVEMSTSSRKLKNLIQFKLTVCLYEISLANNTLLSLPLSIIYPFRSKWKVNFFTKVSPKKIENKALATWRYGENHSTRAAKGHVFFLTNGGNIRHTHFCRHKKITQVLFCFFECQYFQEIEWNVTHIDRLLKQ